MDQTGGSFQGRYMSATYMAMYDARLSSQSKSVPSLESRRAIMKAHRGSLAAKIPPNGCALVPLDPPTPPGPPPPDPVPAPPAPPGMSHYSNPKGGKCAPDETSVTIPGPERPARSARRTARRRLVGCPIAKPPGTTAEEGVCVLANTNSLSTHLGLGSRNVTKGHSWAERSTTCKACVCTYKSMYRVVDPTELHVLLEG